MNTFIGLLLAFIGGGLQGGFVLPMKYMKNWKWENGWFVYTIMNCLVFPLILAFATIPNLMDIYRSSSVATINTIFLFGIGWGIGSVLFGLGADFLGMTIGIAIITGINACLGTLFPLLFLTPGRFTLKAGIFLGIGMLILIGGVIRISQAGQQRTKELGLEDKRIKVPFLTGLLVCIFAGIFSPMMNFGIFFGQPISQLIKSMGTVSAINIGYAQLLPVLVGGSIPQILYCIYLFNKNHSFKNYAQSGSGLNWLKGTSMAVLWILGMVIYTLTSVNFIPEIGPIVGWPLFLSALIIVSNILGVLTKEWEGVSRKVFSKMYQGITLLIIAIVVISLSNLFL